MNAGSGKDQNSALEAWLSRKKTKKPAPGISPKPINEASVLSYGQERLWLLEQLYPDQNLYHYAHRYRIEGALNLDALIAAFQLLAERHEVIKSRYQVIDGVSVQVTGTEPLPVEYIDLRKRAEKDQEVNLRSKTKAFCSVPFNLEDDVLFRIYCFRLSEQSFEILIVLHHIIGDAWSMSIINQELRVLYEAQITNRHHRLPELQIQYKDFAWWHRKQPVRQRDLDFWKKKLSGELPVLNLPFKRQSASDFSGGTYKAALPPELKEQLTTLAQQQGVTMFALMLAGFKLLLSKYTDQTDILVGSPFSNRDQKSLEKLVGFFNETLVLRTEVAPELTFAGLINQVKDTTLEALSHKNVPFDTLVNELKVDRQAGENPLFQTMFLYNTPGEKLSLGNEIMVSEEVVALQTSKFDLTLFVNERPEDLELVFEYSGGFEPGMIPAMSSHFQSLLENVLNFPELKLADISLFPPAYLDEQSTFWHGKRRGLPGWKSVHELIINQAREKSEQIAVSTPEGKLSYAELDRWSDQVAEKLKEQGAKPNDFIGLLTPRSVEMIVGILGILKAGAAYLPLDPDYPKERLEFMLADTKAEIILVHPRHKAQLAGERKELTIREDPDYQASASSHQINHLQNYAYVIYTSGSTGRPKGVPVTHENLLYSTSARFGFFKEEVKRFLLLSSFSFDSSVVGIFWSLCCGGRLVLPAKHIEQDISTLTDIIEEVKVTHTLMLPSLYQVILSHAQQSKLRSLEAVMVAGEACSTGLKDLHFSKLPETRLYNEYGPTEATVWCIAHEITNDDKQIPIGNPIQNYSAYILNSHMQALPPGVAGELYIGGKGVTNGYLNRPELTAERFLDDPFSIEGTKMYKTGDLALFRPDGVIEFLGRADQQVKIRGFRVEPEEIRNRILQVADISEAVVKVLEDTSGNKQLVSWVQTDKTQAESYLRAELKSSLPDYMVPSHIMAMAILPKLPNGKVDVQQLAAPQGSQTSGHEYRAPANEKERLVTAIWQEVLGLEQIGTEDNFFDIGGDSILSIRIVAKAREKGLKIGPTDIFKYQQIKTLVLHASSLTTEADSENVQYPVSFPLSYQQQAFLLHSLQAKEDQGFLQLEFNIKGRVDPELMKKAWEQVLMQHPVMRASFHWDSPEDLHQTVDEKASLSWQFLDFTESEGAVEERIADFKEADSKMNLDLRNTGGGRFALIKTGESDFLLIWTCHHILVDGWSGAIIVKDALLFYDALAGKKTITLDPVAHFRKYLDWKTEQDNKEARTFWKKMLQGTSPPLFTDAGSQRSESHFQDLDIYPDSAITEALQKTSRHERLTINSVLQGLWMLTLASYFKSKEVALGLTLTGRSSDFPGIDRMTGLLMNVLPVSMKIDADSDLRQWLNKLQDTLNQLRQFEHVDTNQVQAWAGEENKSFFDSLFVFGNFMNEALTVGGLTVEEFKGGFSATFPLTIRVNPAAQLEINCRYDTNVVNEETARWLLNTYEAILTKVAEQADFDALVGSLLADAPALAPPEITKAPPLKAEVHEFAGTRNSVELALLRIWEKVIGAQLIGIHDNYFDAGGTSLGAIRLFAEIEQQFGKKLSPTTIVHHPTISSLAQLLGTGDENEGWSSIVPMKTSGDAPPLFCVHSGGAHVLFYQGLAKYMSDNRPVYAIQPTGIDGEEEMHETIPEMAAHYVSEMQKIQSKGPYHLIGTCFGNAVGLEMAHQLKQKGEKLAVLYVIDSAPAFITPPSPNGERKPVSRMAAMIKKGDWRAILKKFKGRYARVQRKLNSGNKTEQELELDEIVDSLNDMYVKYTWRPLEDKIVLIRSSEFSQRKEKGFHLEQWRLLAGDQLEVYEVEGKHLTIFEEPEVERLTHKIVEHMSTLEIA